jgi:lysophospholipase L1-like esterase
MSAWHIWLQRIGLIAFAPLLAIQGKYARLTTPVLPEPSGDRFGCSGNGVRLKLLVAGDSAAAGVGVMLQQDALCGQLVVQLAQTHTVDWRLVAKTGYTTPELMARISSEALPPVDVVVLSLGVNDITSGVLASQWIEQQAGLMALLREQLGAKLIVIAKIPPMHEFTALPQPLRWLLGMRAKRFNALLSEASVHWPNCTLLTPEVDTAPSALASDGFHPGPYTYRRWAEEAAQIVLSKLL